MHNYIIVGPQGSGKGTQASRLCSDHEFAHISTGDIFRWNMQNFTKLAAKVKRIMNQGHLVPDEIVQDLVRRRLDEHDWNHGFVLDGFPRTVPQAEFLFEHYNVDKAIYLDIPDDIVYERVMYRAKVGDGGTKRADDNPEALKIRLQEYKDKTEPLLDLFEKRGMLLRIPGAGTIDEVYAEMCKALNLPAPA